MNNYIFRNKMKIFTIKINNLKYKDFFKEISKLEKQNIVFTPNPEMLLKLSNDFEFKKIFNKCTYSIPDWIWIYLAYQILDNKYNKIINTILIPYYLYNIFFKKLYLFKKYWEKICWSDLTKDILNFAIENSIKITIIDLYSPKDIKKVENQKKFSNELIKNFPYLKFDYYIYKEEEKNLIINNICKSDSKILFSTLWMKKQEISIIEIMEKCNNIKLGIWVWSSFDYFTWFQKRAPKIWKNLWIEWLYRLINWPKKINRLKRLYNAIFIFTYKVLKTK